jgi:hypothetical protein
MTFSSWDIVEIFAPSAGYDKYHICVEDATADVAGRFLYMNSDSDYESDFPLKCSEIPCLPKSRTGLSVVSCNGLARYNTKQLKLYKAATLGNYPLKHRKPLLEFIENCRALPSGEKKIILAALKA